jgi:hypothetical protein
LEEAQNAGEAAILDLLRVKIEVARESIVEKMNNMFHNDGTGNGSKDFNGLDNIVGTLNNTVGGIDSTTNTWWDPYHHSTNSSQSGTPVALSLANMYNTFNGASVGADTPGFVLMEQDQFEVYEGLLDGDRRYVDSTVADAGFQALTFKGKPVLYDSDTNFTANYVYFINPKYLRLKVHRDRFFKAGPFIQPRDQDLRTMKMLTYGNLTVNNRSRQGMLEVAA